jgi:hypothetical protein
LFSANAELGKKKVREEVFQFHKKIKSSTLKLTAFLQLQEFSQRNLPAFIAFAARLSFLG